MISTQNINISLHSYSLRKLFELQLEIPDYQRAYSWLSAHVIDLLNDTFERTSTYLMGTIILHNDNKKHEIIDGQQRLVTLTIILNILQDKFECGKGDSKALPLLKSKFPEGAAKVIRNTKAIVINFLNQKTQNQRIEYYEYLMADGKTNNKGYLEFTILVLSGANALDQAYTFFDSVNSKGKALSDFDLLKAHHLMFVPPQQEALATSHNNEWQSGEEIHSHIFSTILRRIRMWGRGESRDSKQNRPDFNEFSSVVEPDHHHSGEHLFNRYMQPAAFRSWRRVGDKIILSMDYPSLEGELLMPIEVTQTIEGGDSFFLYAKRYHRIYSTLFSPASNELSTEINFVRKIGNYINNTYLKNAFRAALLLTYDKFGEDCLIEIAVCLERIISARRFASTNLKIEGALDYIHHKKIIPILLNSISASHVVAQFYSEAKLLPFIKINDLKGVRLNDFYSMKNFYVHELPKILDTRISNLASFYNQSKD